MINLYLPVSLIALFLVWIAAMLWITIASNELTAKWARKYKDWFVLGSSMIFGVAISPFAQVVFNRTNFFTFLEMYK